MKSKLVSSNNLNNIIFILLLLVVVIVICCKSISIHNNITEQFENNNKNNNNDNNTNDNNTNDNNTNDNKTNDNKTNDNKTNDNIEAEITEEHLSNSLRAQYESFKQTYQEAAKSKPDFLDVDKDGNKTEPMKKALKDKDSKGK